MTITNPDITRMECALTGNDGGDVVLRRVYADALDDAGRLADAASERRVADLIEKGTADAWEARIVADFGEAVFETDSDTFVVNDEPCYLFDPEQRPDLDVDDDHNLEWVSESCEVLSPREWALRQLEGVPQSAVFLEHCPRGFANEVGYYWTDDRERAERLVGSTDWRGRGRGWTYLTPGELADCIVSGATNAADARWRNECTSTNPTCGSYVVEPLGDLLGMFAEDFE